MASGTKVCGICGRDVAGRPRVRDPAGGYYCQDCHQQALADTDLAGAADSDPLAALASAAAGDPRSARQQPRSTGGSASVRSSPPPAGSRKTALSFNAVCWLVAIVLFAILGLCKLLFPDHGPSVEQPSEPSAVAAGGTASPPPAPAASASPDLAPPAAEAHREIRGDPNADRQQIHYGQPSVILMPNLTPGRLALQRYSRFAADPCRDRFAAAFRRWW